MKKSGKWQNINLQKYLEIRRKIEHWANNEEFTIEGKKSLFEIKNKMVDIPSQFPKSESIDKYFCCEILEM